VFREKNKRMTPQKDRLKAEVLKGEEKDKNKRKNHPVQLRCPPLE